MKDRTALIINPWITDFKLYDEWMHPLGLYFLISLLKHNGWEIRYVDCLRLGAPVKKKRHATGEFISCPLPKPPAYKTIPRNYKRYGTTNELLARHIGSLPRPSAVFVGSGMTYWLPGVADTVRLVRQTLPDTPIVIGGIGATLMPGYLQDAAAGVTLFTGGLLNGAVSLFDGAIRTDGWQPSLIAAFETTGPLPHGPVLSTLGCPLSCAYCASSILQPGCSVRDGAVVAQEVAGLARRHGVTDFAFYDDALLFQPRQRLFKLLDRLEVESPGLRFHTPNGLHLQWFTDPVARRMRRAGFETLRFGYETSAAAFRGSTCTKATRTLTEAAMRTAQRAGFRPEQIGVYVMAGLQGQSPKQVDAEMTFISSLGVLVKPVFVSPVPGTPLFESYARQMPKLCIGPYWHNDTFFITQLDGWGWSAADEVRQHAGELNDPVLSRRSAIAVEQHGKRGAVAGQPCSRPDDPADTGNHAGQPQ